jgi:glyoxylase-like metal-dependent hydrolase (beta-lactamase superfamily II)
MKITPKLHAFIWNSMTTNNCNTYLIEGSKRILIDPGHADLFGHVRDGLDQLGLAIKDIDLVICTHAHPDHLESATIFKSEKVLFAIHETEWNWLKEMEAHIRGSYGIEIEAIQPDFLLKEGRLILGDIQLWVIHTPGHSKGSISLYWPEENALFTGDLVFQSGFGRTDLPGGDSEQLKTSIQKIAELDVKWLLPGHGNIISSTSEVKANFDQIAQMMTTYL